MIPTSYVKDPIQERLAAEASVARRRHWAPFFKAALQRGEIKRRLRRQREMTARPPLITTHVEPPEGGGS
jgi:hypothetical protein